MGPTGILETSEPQKHFSPGLKTEEKVALNGIVLSRVLGEDTECEREG